jgi:hypothetical protein
LPGQFGVEIDRSLLVAISLTSSAAVHSDLLLLRAALIANIALRYQVLDSKLTRRLTILRLALLSLGGLVRFPRRSARSTRTATSPYSTNGARYCGAMMRSKQGRRETSSRRDYETRGRGSAGSGAYSSSATILIFSPQPGRHPKKDRVTALVLHSDWIAASQIYSKWHGSGRRLILEQVRRTLHYLRRRGINLVEQRLDLGAGNGPHIEIELSCLGQKTCICQGCVEGGA